MKIENYVISTLHDLDLMHEGRGNRYFALANFYRDYEHYRNYFLELRKDPKNFITIDCGSAEGDTVTMEQYIDIIDELRPNEAVALDILFEAKETLESLDVFISKMKERGLNSIDIFAAPQGKTKEEWLSCYKSMLNNPDVKVIGLSKIAVPKSFLDKTGDEGIAQARNMCFDYLEEHDLVKKPIHFLGMGEIEEFKHYNNNYIRSTDSCYTVLSGKKGIDFSSGDYTRVKTTNDFYHEKLNETQRKLALANINYFSNLLSEQDT